jgi:hypothetical protein
MDESAHGASMREQLREELLARAWAMHATDVRAATVAPDVAAWIDRAVACWSAMLGDPNPTAQRTAATRLQQVLWPTFRPADEWWTTPLGEALLAADPSSRPASPRWCVGGSDTTTAPATRVTDVDQVVLAS